MMAVALAIVALQRKPQLHPLPHSNCELKNQKLFCLRLSNTLPLKLPDLLLLSANRVSTV